MFHLLRNNLKAEAIKKNITKETYAQFVNRIKRAFMAMPVVTINNLIESMPKRLGLVVESRGARTKY